MNYRTVAELNAETRCFAQDLPTGIDLVIGIPRSGLLAANLLCLHLDVPMTDVDSLCDRDLFDTGNRHEGISLDDIDSALVLDDSVYSGSQMRETKARLDDYDFSFDLEFGAIYIVPDGAQQVDYWGEVVDTPRVFEWNLMHHPRLTNSCVDIDGILCRDPTHEENDDGENYLEFLRTVEPQIIPNERIGWLVTCRLEKYRSETEQWLDEYGVEYDKLVMMDLPSKEARMEQGNHGGYKAEVYEETGAALFIESDQNQAAEICEKTQKPVYCYETNEMITPSIAGRAYRKSSTGLSKLKKNPIGFPAQVSRSFAGRVYYQLLR